MFFRERFIGSLQACRLCFLTLWVAAIVFGIALLAKHDTTPGETGSVQQRWPENTQIRLSDRVPTLVMFAHPRCPCTRTSLTELQAIAANHSNDVSICVVFLQPESTAADWTQTDQVAMAQAIKGSQIVPDIDGAEAKRFETKTSGHTLLYSPSGELLFSGGVTIARGHAGESAGRMTIESILSGNQATLDNTPVFGCSLRNCEEKPN